MEAGRGRNPNSGLTVILDNRVLCLSSLSKFRLSVYESLTNMFFYFANGVILFLCHKNIVCLFFCMLLISCAQSQNKKDRMMLL